MDIDLDQETLDGLVSLAKRIKNQASKRALRTIATREIAAAFNDCGIVPVNRGKTVTMEESADLVNRIRQYSINGDRTLVRGYDILHSEIRDEQLGRDRTLQETMKALRDRIGRTNTLAETERFVKAWADSMGHKFFTG